MYRTGIPALPDSMILVHREEDTISAVDLSLMCFLGTREVTISRSHPVLEHSIYAASLELIAIAQLAPFLG